MLACQSVEHAAQPGVLARLGAVLLTTALQVRASASAPPSAAVDFGGHAAERGHIAQRQPDRDRRVEKGAGQKDQAHQRPVPDHQRHGADRDRHGRAEMEVEGVAEHVERPNPARDVAHGGPAKVSACQSLE